MKNFYLPVKVKITLVTTFFLILFLSGLGYFFIGFYERDQVHNEEFKVNKISNDASKSLSSILIDENIKLISDIAENYLQDENIRYLIVEMQDSIYFEYNKYSAEIDNYKNLENKYSRKWQILKSHSSVEFDKKIVGDVYLGYSINNIYEKIDNLIFETIVIILIITSVFFLLFFFTIGIFTKPIKEINARVLRIVKGNYSTSYKIKTKDEFERISISLNSISEKMSSTKKVIDGINRDFENRINERNYDYKRTLNTLKKENNELKGVETEISKSLNEKEVLLKEIHHRVKNNLQIVSSLFFFQSKKVTDPVMLEILRDGRNRVKSMALIHEKLYQSGDLANIDFKEYIKKLSNFLFQSYSINQGKIRLKINVVNVDLGVDSAVPCGLIINELISNSLKHGFNGIENGEIKIEMGYSEDNKIELSISDNGNGIPENYNIEDSESLGLRLVFNLTTQLNGNVKFLNNGGTTVKLTFENPKFKKAS